MERAIEKNGPEQYLSRTEALQQARAFGMIGLLASMEGSVNTPTAIFGRELASGLDDRNAKGNMFGSTIDDAAGSGGLNLLGIGEGGGGTGEGIGVGRVGTVGHDFVGGNGHSTGRLNGVQAFMAGKLRVSGDMMFAQTMQGWFQRPANSMDGTGRGSGPRPGP